MLICSNLGSRKASFFALGKNPLFPDCSQSCGNPRKIRLSAASIVPKVASEERRDSWHFPDRQDKGSGIGGFHASGIVPIVPTPPGLRFPHARAGEVIIQKGKDTFVEVGTALAEIRDSRIYRATFKTFEDYCKDRWSFTKQTAYQFIEGAEVAGNLKSHNCDSLPSNQGQTRPLAKLPADQQPAAWDKAQEIAKEEGKPVATRHVEAAVLEVMPKDETEPLVVDGTQPPAEKPKRLPKYIPNDAEELWAQAAEMR